MHKIEPINWKQLDNEIMGLQVNLAVKMVCERLTAKVNELVEAYNEQQK